MTVRELYNNLCDNFPASLSCSWDNDGLMCCPNDEREVSRVLIALDVTDAVIDCAIEKGFDLILSHHPLVFRPLRALEPSGHVPRRLIRLIESGISVMSFHTRADAADGGVNDALAEKLGFACCERFGPVGEEMGRVGTLASPMPLDVFASRVKEALGAGVVSVAGDREVCRVAMLGGGGNDFVDAARAAGADTYVTGDLGYNTMEDACSMGINLIAAGHYFTEAPVLERFAVLVHGYAGDVYAEIFNSNEIKIY